MSSAISFQQSVSFPPNWQSEHTLSTHQWLLLHLKLSQPRPQTSISSGRNPKLYPRWQRVHITLKDGENHWNTTRVTDLFGGYVPSLEDIERINWTQSEQSKPQSQTGPNQHSTLSQTVYCEFILQDIVPCYLITCYMGGGSPWLQSYLECAL